MAVVDVTRFNRFLSSPRWSPEQQDAAQDVLDGVEAALASALYGTRITPEPVTETALIIAKSGQVATSFPVFSVSSIDGVAIPEGTGLPLDWRLERHRLYRRVNASQITLLGAFGQPRIAAPYVPYDGSVTVSYMAGWGPERDLVLAIMRKAKEIFLNQHDDSVTARGMTGDAPAPLPEEEWTEADLAPLGRFRRLDLT